MGTEGTISPQVQQWFNAVDKDRSGFITALELKSALVNAQGQTFSETACSLMMGGCIYLHLDFICLFNTYFKIFTF